MTRPPLIQAPFDPPVHGVATTREGGVSRPPFDSFNLGDACGDDPEAVVANRQRLAAVLPGPPHWLRQIHGVDVIHLDDWRPGVEADAAWTDRPGRVVAVLTADCLPVLLADCEGRCVAAVHAGWRGLAAGVLEAAVAALPVAPDRLRAWIGPRIGPAAYEVDGPVRDALGEHDRAFRPTRPGHWQVDLAAIAIERLRASGISDPVDSGLCTAADPARLFSHRRDGRSGRQATLAWITPPD
ncbi:peptidoglycan editing factor PgeF [Wenzhouxiangella sp. XN79A]|uniref:peptidoglycan editing factor PgeF n=1 Tax=Wenzhouxiangella sp. XN79A TaxID=2724193 RepID=UPI00144ABD3D|nr:peptidoglycan editing factor PgeF [Wenzhouxiangella sp. XN79A]NKI36261.1 peptidoglycan editing factor PgeF [Wenzhouxiangella sp. XN79A]